MIASRLGATRALSNFGMVSLYVVVGGCLKICALTCLQRRSILQDMLRNSSEISEAIQQESQVSAGIQIIGTS